MQGESHQPGGSNYLDFELEMGEGHGREYPVAVVHSPAGEARATMRFPFDELVLENRLLKLQNALLRSGGQPRRTLSEEEQAVLDFGRALFEALFTPEVRSCYDVSRREAEQQGVGLRLKLRIQPPELAALPWEFLYHPGQAEYVCLSTRTPVVRYLEVPQRIQPLAVAPPLRILGLIASPCDLPALDVAREQQRIENAIADLRARGLVELAWLPGQTWHDLQRAMRQGPWHIFHFIGHGGFDRHTGEGLIMLADRNGEAAHFGAKRLGRLLADHRSLRLVLLNACEGARGSEHDVFSSTAAILVQRGIPAVLAMQYAITDRAAIEFARTFYEALGDGMPVDGAVAEARKAISFAVANTVEWGTPVLYMRSPDGVLFQMAELPHVAPSPAQVPRRPPELDAEQERRLEQLYLDGLAAFWVDKWEEAARSFQAIVDEYADYQDAADKLAEARRQKRWSALYEQAQAARRAENWEAAHSALEELVAEKPDYKDAAALLEAMNRQVRLASLYAQARQLHRAGRWQATVNVFARIAALAPDYPDPEGLLPSAQEEIAAQAQQAELQDLYRRAVLAVDAGQWAEARELLARVQSQEPGYRETEKLLARVESELEPLAEQRRQEQVAALYDQARQQARARLLQQILARVQQLKSLEPQFTGPDELAAQAQAEGQREMGKAWRRSELSQAPPAATRTAAPARGDVRSFGGVEMVYVPAGKFWMGSNDGAKWAQKGEKPAHEVFVEGFWIDRTPVTNEEYRHFVQATGHQKPKHWKGGRIPKGKEAHPVVYVSWRDARAYCGWRSGQAGVVIRLPTEAEWEKAARGTHGWLYPWGDEFDQKKCNSAERGAGDTWPVGRYSRGDSPYGLADMAGNVWEWTGSLYKPYPYNAQDGREDLKAGGRRVVRGGSWKGNQRIVRVAFRYNIEPSYAYDDVGFRCVRSGAER
jgi:formylglycine-generating enzyme required for sulfatase activity/outer membrane protein assembly factor BamD (BamD/ComL family)